LFVYLFIYLFTHYDILFVTTAQEEIDIYHFYPSIAFSELQVLQKRTRTYLHCDL